MVNLCTLIMLIDIFIINLLFSHNFNLWCSHQGSRNHITFGWFLSQMHHACVIYQIFGQVELRASTRERELVWAFDSSYLFLEVHMCCSMFHSSNGEGWRWSHSWSSWDQVSSIWNLTWTSLFPFLIEPYGVFFVWFLTFS